VDNAWAYRVVSVKDTGENCIMGGFYVRRLFSAMWHCTIWQKFADTVRGTCSIHLESL